MKSLAELNALKEKLKSNTANSKEKGEGTKIIVGMATCGIAAGAKPVMAALKEEINVRHVENVKVAQAGCIGICQYEPVVEVYEPGKEKVTYVKMDAEKAKKVIDEHIINGKIIVEYTIGSVTTTNSQKQ
ncbi:MAG: (2Fe-2S) ferredoxin domain-containing protein [Oscillospiraceae bacterium]|nr:(2Fe-2S) ferredoxin domain-containing protein [Oscillospiraceae bacterium]